MAILIVFEVVNPQTRKALVEALEHFGDCIRFGESSYAVRSSQAPASVYDGLKLHLGPDDHLLVLPLTKPYTGGNARVQQWLDKNLTD
jgi:hypothetical protein